MGKHENVQEEVTIKDLYKLIKETTKQNIDVQNQIKEEIKTLKDDIFTKLNNLEKENEELKVENNKLKTNLLASERKQKKYNIVIYGIQNKENDLLISTLNTFNNILKVTCTENDIRDIYMIGSSGQEKSRPVVVEFVNYRLKTNILKNAGELKNTGIVITQDYTTHDYQDRKFLAKQLKIARQEFPSAKIKKNILIVNDDKYTLDELKLSPLEDKGTTPQIITSENSMSASGNDRDPNTAPISKTVQKQLQDKKSVRGPERADENKVVRSSSRTNRN